MSKNARQEGVEKSAQQLILVAGEISALTRVTVINSSSGVYAVTIQSGRYDGQEKFVIHLVGANAVTLSGAFFKDTNVSTNSPGESYHMIWNEADANWYVVGVGGATLTA